MTGIIPYAAWQVSLLVLDQAPVDLTPKLAPRVTRLTLSERRGGEADQLEISIDNTDGRVAIPPKGAVLKVAIGWARGSGVPIGLVDKGSFHVDETGAEGPPDVITLRARSADLASGFTVRKERGFVGKSVGTVIAAIAADNGYTARVDGDLAGKVIPALGHGPMSDAALLKALGRRYDATATVKAGFLVFAHVGKGRTAGGTTIPPILLARTDGGPYRYTSPKRGQYNGVEAHWHDKASASRQVVSIGVSGTGKPKRLRKIYANETDARDACAAAYNRMGRDGERLELTLPFGRPDYYPDRAVTVSGYLPEIDAIPWLIGEIAHDMDGRGGLVSRMTLETGPASKSD